MEDAKQVYRLYILFKDRTPIIKEIVETTVEMILGKGELADLGVGSAYNMPIYLLGEIEDYPDEAVVVAIDWDEDDMIHPRFLVEENEINMLIDALEENQDRDSWEIVVEVNKKIRGK